MKQLKRLGAYGKIFRPTALPVGILRRFGVRRIALAGFIACLCVGVSQLLPPERPAPFRESADDELFHRNAISREERGSVRRASPNMHGGLIVFTENGVALLTAVGARSLEPFADEAPLYGRASDEALFLFAASPPDQYGEALDASGRPLRWAAQQATPGRRHTPSTRKTAPVRLAALPERLDEQLFSRAQRYKALIERLAVRYAIKTELIYAIIHNESNFQPDVVSSRMALGLMQLMPAAAGREAHKFLNGQAGELDAAALMNPENNLLYGVAYLHLLLTRYFGDVAHPNSRELCAIAAYNLGPAALLNNFARDRDEAIAAINSLSPRELYERLAQEMPVRETRNFIARVLASKKEFADFQ
ncbi:MAG: transglycosylase SLT domain-containing protein [Deltaproteobacteria bacterium]|jgi:membrane-bound lytic murein transglycosylase C|nr:transglycosylase SLT domain-containing protein [Deltaproteobacteria bacterium]